MRIAAPRTPSSRVYVLIAPGCKRKVVAFRRQWLASVAFAAALGELQWLKDAGQVHAWLGWWKVTRAKARACAVTTAGPLAFPLFTAAGGRVVDVSGHVLVSVEPALGVASREMARHDLAARAARASARASARGFPFGLKLQRHGTRVRVGVLARSSLPSLAPGSLETQAASGMAALKGALEGSGAAVEMQLLAAEVGRGLEFAAARREAVHRDHPDGPAPGPRRARRLRR